MRAALIVTALLVQLAALGSTVPLPAKDMDEDSDKGGPLPFLQFTKGGIRVNFGGYHAQAGLGGILTGRSQDGGLHASAGLPSGAHASAGLGGSLTNGPEGGLHARAGLGNGGPEAEAGLSGSLAGPKPSGDIYSRAQIADGIEVQKNKGKNIQVIARPKKASELDAGIAPKKELVAASASANAASRSEDDSEVLNDAGFEQPDKPAKPDKPDKPDRPEKPDKPALGVGVRATAEAGSSSAGHSDHHSGTSVNSTNGFRLKYNKSSTLFDDIFNIPISALTAVNKLLKNHVGRK